MKRQTEPKIIPPAICDFYKLVHSGQYPKGITNVTSYYTARMTRLDGHNHVVVFGIQAFVIKYFIGIWNEHFFEKDLDEVMADFVHHITGRGGANVVDTEKIRRLHNLGYLPIEVSAIEEGTRVPVKVPMLQIRNTHPEFAWVTNSLESIISASLWKTMINANVGYMYRQIANEYYEQTVIGVEPNRAMGDFSMRGMDGEGAAVRASAGFCLSFLGTATEGVNPWMECYYNCDATKESVSFGALSTEHSVMNSNFAVDGDEITMVKRLLTEIYPNDSFSMVSDSYDYWNLVDTILPACRNEIENHNGFVGIRGDSGDPVDIICGTKIFPEYKSISELIRTVENEVWATEYGFIDGKYYKVNGCVVTNEACTVVEGVECEVMEYHPTPEELGTVELLWMHFPGTVNSKGYKVLPTYIKAIYGDSITPQRARNIYRKLAQKGFAANNVSLGVGSFSMLCLEVEDHGEYRLSPYTRDTFGVAIKATYCEVNGKAIPIFKDPKTDTGNFKKSQKGMCAVLKDDENGIHYIDGLTTETAAAFDEQNLLKPLFRDGKMLREQSLQEIRAILHDGKF